MRVKRYLFNLLGIGCTLLCAATLLSWVASYIWRNEIRISGSSRIDVLAHCGSVFAAQSWQSYGLDPEANQYPGLELGTPIWLGDADKKWRIQRWHFRNDRSDLLPDGFQFHRFDSTGPEGLSRAVRTTGWNVVIPFSYLLVAFAIPAAFFLFLTYRDRKRPLGCCPTCGYDLRATPDRCPECGNSPAR